MRTRIHVTQRPPWESSYAPRQLRVLLGLAASPQLLLAVLRKDSWPAERSWEDGLEPASIWIWEPRTWRLHAMEIRA